MHKYFFVVVGLLIIFPIDGMARQIEYRTGELLVKFQGGTDIETFLAGHRVSGLDLKVKRHFPRSNVWHLTFRESGLADREVLSLVRADPRTVAAQFNHRVQVRQTVPNDQYFQNQWSLHNTGQTGGSAGADISATPAWQVTTGSNGLTALGDQIVLAVIDGGFDLNHEDMSFTETVYDVHRDSQDPNDMTMDWHGVAVAGVAGALGNNQKGISGVGWTSKILPVGGLYSQFGLFEDYVIASYEFVLDRRVQYNESDGHQGEYVVATNSSFGIDEADPEDHQVWCSMYDHLGWEGILSVAATMNRDLDVDVTGDVPTGCPSQYLISVTNTTHNDEKYSDPHPFDGAAWGATTIELGAPGTLIFTTLPGNTYGNQYLSGGFTLDVTGTSFAAPHVAGTVGMIYSILPPDFLIGAQSNPLEAVLDVKSMILNSVDEISSLENITISGGRLNLYRSLKYAIENHGAVLGIEKPQVTLPLWEDMNFHADVCLASGSTLRIEAHNTVKLTAASGSVTIGCAAPGTSSSFIASVPPDNTKITTAIHDDVADRPAAYRLSQNYPNPFNPSTNIPFTLPEAAHVTLTVYDLLGQEVTVLVSGHLPAGEHTATFYAANMATGVYLYRLTAGGFMETRRMAVVR